MDDSDSTPVMVDLKKYMSEIGRKGGKANKGKATEKCRLAAKARWAKYRANQEDEISAPSSSVDNP
jgi:general stress protein YciG